MFFSWFCRYIAIVHPIKAHIFCSRRHILMVIGCIWPFALLCGLPTALLNQVMSPHPSVPVDLCIMHFPGHNENHQMAFKLAEFVMYFLFPIIIQIVMYTIVCKHLFVGTEHLHRKQAVENKGGRHKQKDSDAIKARKGVVKMLVAIVIVYFLSYAPAQIPLFYDIASSTPFKRNWAFLVFLMTLGYVNSAANPILYSIFSQNFRRKFQRMLCCCIKHEQNVHYSRAPSNAFDVSKKSTVRFSNSRMITTMTSVSEM